MSLVALFKGRGPSGFGYGSTTDEVTDGLDLSGRTILVTGSNSGLGFETMRSLVARGARVLALARTTDKAERAGAQVDGEVVPYACDLSEPSHVRACVATIQADAPDIDAMILNAGIMAVPDRQVRYGHELQFLTNHLGHFILATGLLDRLTPQGRVIALSSSAHSAAPDGGIVFDNITLEGAYKPWAAYGQSKLANLLFARALAGRLPEGQVANAVHPGVISTNLSRHLPGVGKAVFKVASPLFLKTVPQGAATQVWAATHPETATVRGEYLADVNVSESSADGRDRDLAERLWEATEEWVASLPA